MKLKIITFLILLFCFSFWSTQISWAESYMVKAYVIVPYGADINPSIIEKYKPNILGTLAEAKEFYRQKLQGHAFEYSQNVEILNVTKSLSEIDTRGSDRGDLIAEQLGINKEESGLVKILFIMGADFTPRGGGRGDKGMVYLPGEAIAQFGRSKWWTGALIHELTHAFGLLYSGWAAGHPCTIRSIQECNGPSVPVGLGTSIPYPPADEAKYSIIGSGTDFYGGPESSKVGFNNTEANPEVRDLYLSSFINPNHDLAPVPISEKGGSLPKGEITDVISYDAKVGDTVRILGTGFGDTRGRFEFFGYPDPKIEIKNWKNSEIVFYIKSMDQEDQTDFKLAIKPKNSDEQIFTPQTLTILPGKKKITINSVSPSSIEVGKELVILGGNLQVGGVIRITNPGSEIPIISNFKINRYSNNEIRISILEGPSKPTIYNVDIVNPSGELLVSIPIEIRPVSSQTVVTANPNPLIFSIEPSEVFVGEDFSILGQNFGTQPGTLDFIDTTGTSRISSSGYSWSDKKIKVTIEKASYTGTAILNVSVVMPSGKKVLSPVKLTLNIKQSTPTPFPTQAPTPTPTPTSALHKIICLTFLDIPPPGCAKVQTTGTSVVLDGVRYSCGSLTPYECTQDVSNVSTSTPTPIPTPTVSASPIASTEIPCGNGGICRNGACFVGDSIDPNGVCPGATGSSSTPTPTPTATPVQQAKKKEITKIAVVNVDDGRVLQEIDPKVSLALSFHLPVAGINKILVYIYYSEGDPKRIPFTFNYASVTPITPSTPSPPPSCGAANNNDPCSESQLGQSKKNSCTTASGLAGQSVAVCEKVGSIYCWHDAYFDPGAPKPASQFCYESKESSISGLGENKLSCSSPSCLRGTPIQRPTDGSWYCYEGERWVGNAICLSAPPPTLSNCDPQKVTCATGEIAIRSVNGTWVCANISTGQITSSVPICSQ